MTDERLRTTAREVADELRDVGLRWRPHGEVGAWLLELARRLRTAASGELEEGGEAGDTGTTDVKIPAETIEEVIEKFDFESVHEHMLATEWTWGQPDGGLAVPSISDLHDTVRELMGHLEVPGVFYVASGGFLACITPLSTGFEAALYFTLQDSRATFGTRGAYW